MIPNKKDDFQTEIAFFDIVEVLHLVVGVNRYIVPYIYFTHFTACGLRR